MTPSDIQNAEFVIFREVQRECFHQEIENLEHGQNINKNSPLIELNPFLDHNKILRIGGRIKHSNEPFELKQPIIMPKNHHVSVLLVEKYHAEIKHQGHHFTHGALRVG